MSYIEENLLPGEQILYTTKVHWLIYGMAIFMLLIAGATYWFFPDYPAAAWFLLLLAFISGVRAFIARNTTEYGITSQRIIVKTGWVSRMTVEQQLPRIESVNFTQTVWGRVFGYGTVLLHGTGSGVTPISGIDNPLEFHKYALMAIQQFGQRD